MSKHVTGNCHGRFSNRSSQYNIATARKEILQRIQVSHHKEFLANMKAFRRAIVVCAVLFSQGCYGYDPEASITGLYTGPYFDPLAPRNLTAHMGDQATLPCTVRQLGDKSVSWVRMRDADILTVDRYTFVGDERFESHYSAPMETWNLVIKYVQERDAGLYECQVSTEPKMSQLFSLRVVIPKVTIMPPGDRYVKAGSRVQVDCQITDVVQLPDYIFWYHDGKRVLDQQDRNLMVTVKKTGAESITSTFTIHKVNRADSGNYTCMPSNLHSASVTLHVLNEEHPAGLQGERNTSSSTVLEAKLFTTLFVLLVLIAWSPALEYIYSYDRKSQIPAQEYLEGLTTLSLKASPAESCSVSIHMSSFQYNNILLATSNKEFPVTPKGLSLFQDISVR